MTSAVLKFLVLALFVLTSAHGASRRQKTSGSQDAAVPDQEEQETGRRYNFADTLVEGRRFRFPEDDAVEPDREFTVGAHYSVASAPVYGHQKVQPSYLDNYRRQTGFKTVSDDFSDFFQQRHAKSKKHKKVKLFKPATQAPQTFEPIHSAERDFQIRDPDPREFKANFKLQDVPNLYDREKSFEEVASSGQIEAFLEDQQKLIDEAIELQLLNDPSPSAKGRYHQFLKAKDDERIEKEYVEKLKKQEEEYRQSTPKFLREPHDSYAAQRKPTSPEVGYFHPPTFQGTYSFEIDI